MSRKACAAFLGVSVRTVRYWDAGQHRVPWSAVRLLRLKRAGDLGALHDGWAGWTLNERTAELVSPNGYSFQPGRLQVWPLLCEQARFWRDDYGRRAGERLEGASRGAAMQHPTGQTLSCPASGKPQRAAETPFQLTAFLPSNHAGGREVQAARAARGLSSAPGLVYKDNKGPRFGANRVRTRLAERWSA